MYYTSSNGTVANAVLCAANDRRVVPRQWTSTWDVGVPIRGSARPYCASRGVSPRCRAYAARRAAHRAARRVASRRKTPSSTAHRDCTALFTQRQQLSQRRILISAAHSVELVVARARESRCVHARAHTHLHAHANTHTHIYMHTHIYTHTRITHKHIHTCLDTRRCASQARHVASHTRASARRCAERRGTAPHGASNTKLRHTDRCRQ